LMGHKGLTTLDTGTLRLLLRHGAPVATRQISSRPHRCCAAGSAPCQKSNVRLPAYGALSGGFLADRWDGAPGPGHDGARGAPARVLAHTRSVNAAGP
jgi:hypothetical protein